MVYAMTFQNPPPEKIKQLLEEAETIAVVGLSPDPRRPSHMVAKAMRDRGYRIFPVNPNAKQIWGQICYPSLRDIPDRVDIVNVFRRSDQVLPIALEAVEIQAKVFWLQQGIVHEEAAEIARKGGLEVVMDLCIKVADSVLRPQKGGM